MLHKWLTSVTHCVQKFSSTCRETDAQRDRQLTNTWLFLELQRFLCEAPPVTPSILFIIITESLYYNSLFSPAHLCEMNPKGLVFFLSLQPTQMDDTLRLPAIVHTWLKQPGCRCWHLAPGGESCNQGTRCRCQSQRGLMSLSTYCDKPQVQNRFFELHELTPYKKMSCNHNVSRPV